MPRANRVTWLNYPHLVIAEANGGASLFQSECDYVFYVSLLRQLVRDRLLKVFAFCLMKHELRLVIEPSRLQLSRIMQRLHGRYTSYINRHHERVGHLFRGRFKSIVFNSCDLPSVVRGVHLWPVRTGILRRSEFYPYASHAAYMGYSNADFLATSEVLNYFIGDEQAKRRAFARFVESSALEPDEFGINEYKVGIGCSSLIEKAGLVLDTHKKPSLKRLADRACLLLNTPIEQLLSMSRRQDLVMARRLLSTAAVLGVGNSVSEVAHFLERDKAQVSRLVSQGIDLLESDEAFIIMYETLKVKAGFED